MTSVSATLNITGFNPTYHFSDPKLPFDQLSNNQTSNLAKDYRFNMVVSGILTAWTGHLLPLFVFAISCLEGAHADQATLDEMNQERINTFEEINNERQEGLDQGSNEEVSDQQIEACRKQLVEELSEWTPSEKNKLVQAGKDIFSIISDAWKITKMFIGKTKKTDPISGLVMWPVDEVKKSYIEFTRSYWLNIVIHDYREIFNSPRAEALLLPGDAAEIEFMQKKLKEHGYHPRFGSPLQYLKILKAKGVCEWGSYCNNQKREL